MDGSLGSIVTLLAIDHGFTLIFIYVFVRMILHGTTIFPRKDTNSPS